MKSDAVYSEGAGSVTGAVRFSYGFTREAAAAVSGSYPPVPAGSSLRQFTPCSSSRGQIPLIVNGLYQPRAGTGSSRATEAVIVQVRIRTEESASFDA